MYGLRKQRGVYRETEIVKTEKQVCELLSQTTYLC